MFSLFFIIVCALVALIVLGVSVLLILLKLGVIVRAAAQPAYQDYGDYTLDQGREVRPEDERGK